MNPHQITIGRMMLVVAGLALLLGFCRAIGALPALLLTNWFGVGGLLWFVCRGNRALAVRVLVSTWLIWAGTTTLIMVGLRTDSLWPGTYFFMFFFPSFLASGLALAILDWGPDPWERIPFPELALLGLTALMGVVIGVMIVALLISWILPRT